MPAASMARAAPAPPRAGATREPRSDMSGDVPSGMARISPPMTGSPVGMLTQVDAAWRAPFKERA